MTEIKHNELIAERIQQLINEKNLTTNRLAVLANLTQSTVNSIYNGQSKNPTLKTIFNISTALDLSLIEFLNFSPYNAKPKELEESPGEIIKQIKKLSNELEILEKRIKDME